MCYALNRRLPGFSGDSVRVFLVNLRAGDMVNFTFADNVKGYSSPVVPDIVHFVFLGNRPLTLVDAISIRAAWLQKRPRRLVLHCQNCSALSLSFHWALVERIPGLDIRHIEVPEADSSVRYTDAELTPLLALTVLLAEGGIYVDRDTYLMSNADVYRRFEMSLALPQHGQVRTELIVAHRNARLLRLLLNGYRRLFSQPGGPQPTELFSRMDKVLPANFSSMSLFHHIPVTVKDAITRGNSIEFSSPETARMLYAATCDDSWRHLAAVSLMTGSAEQMTETRGEPPVNLAAIALSRTNLGQMARLALSGTTAVGETRIGHVSDISVLQYAEDPCKF
ncbi:hypothetical protein HPB52_001379 [Rhipicephalus sanguineus]|uniref:Uncharacterized protein n=1 Tax=Rhipicephalus sanguineus TaxID=34632 RepID=A0A9D4PTM8_RHISA|nr:hypothetical protein HPB52_001379 [Rhipicephalus sanguineus]